MGFFKGKKKEAGATDALDTRDAPGSKTSKEKRNKFTFMKATRARKSPSTPRTRSTNTSTTPRTETGETTPRSTPSSSPSKSISDEQEDTATSTRASSPPRNGEQDTSVVVPSPPLPKRYILDDLNVMDSYPDDELDEDAGGMELVLGDILSIPTEETTPAPGTPTKSIILSRRPPGDMELVLEGILPVPSEETSSTSSTPTTPSRQQQQQPQTVAEVRNKKAFNRITVEQEQETSFEYGPPDESLETHQDMVRQVQEKLKAVGSKERLISQIKSFESTDKPQVYEDDSDSDSIADDRVRRQHVSTTTMTEAAIVTLERSSLPQPDVSKSPRNVTSSQASPTPYDKKAYDPTIREQERTTTKNIANTNRPMTDAVTNKLIQAFNCTGDMLPEQLQKHIPNIQTCATDFTVMSTAFQKGVPKKEPVYNDQFAVDFLDELLNVGFALVSHQPPTKEQPDWMGRSVTMLLRPGICNPKTTTPPQLEWSTMGGGMAPRVETRSVPLLKIHSVTNSPTDNNKNDSPDDDEERNCFFTLTTQDGQVHVFETIATEESDRLVKGIQNLVARLSTQLIAGDVNAVCDFYNNSNNNNNNNNSNNNISGEAEKMEFTPEEAMVRLSHSFFD